MLHKHDIDVVILHFDMLLQLKKRQGWNKPQILNLFTCHISTCLISGLPQILCQRSWVKRVSVDMFGRLRRALRLVGLLMLQKSQGQPYIGTGGVYWFTRILLLNSEFTKEDGSGRFYHWPSIIERRFVLVVAMVEMERFLDFNVVMSPSREGGSR